MNRKSTSQSISCVLLMLFFISVSTANQKIHGTYKLELAEGGMVGVGITMLNIPVEYKIGYGFLGINQGVEFGYNFAINSKSLISPTLKYVWLYDPILHLNVSHLVGLSLNYVRLQSERWRFVFSCGVGALPLISEKNITLFFPVLGAGYAFDFAVY